MYFIFAVWTACGDSIVRAYDAKSGGIKRQFVGHEAAVNCMMITGGKLYTGSSDGTLRIWDAKEISDEMMQDDGAPPPAPEAAEDSAEVDAVVAEDTPAEESEEVAEGEAPEGEAVEDIEGGEGEEAGEEGEPPAEGDEAEPAPEGEEAPADEGETGEAEEAPGKEEEGGGDDMEEIAASG